MYREREGGRGGAKEGREKEEVRGGEEKEKEVKNQLSMAVPGLVIMPANH